MHADFVRQTLGLDDRDQVEERGVFPPPESDDDPVLAAEPIAGDEPVLGLEWLDDPEFAVLFSDDPALGAVLPSGRVKRFDVEPRILLFEDIHPYLTRGSVVEVRPGTWIMDARVGPAVLIFAIDSQRVALLGEDGDVRLFVLRPAS